MRMTLLGTGTPILDGRTHGSATLIELANGRALVDAGRGVVAQLEAAGTHPRAIDAVFLTHHHHDHISSLGELLLTAWHNGRSEPVDVYGPAGTRAIVAALFDNVFARDIAFALLTEPDRIDIRRVVRVHDVDEGAVHAGVTAARVDHGHGLGMSHDDWPCLAYRFEDEARVVAISGDAADCAGLDRIAIDADVLLQCCYLAEAELATPGFRMMADHVIASSDSAGRIAGRNRVGRLVLTHIRPKTEAMLQSLVADVRRNYDGDVIVARDLMVLDV